MLNDVQTRLTVRSTEKSFERLTLRDIKEAFDKAGGCLIGIDRQPESHHSATFTNHFQRTLSDEAGPLYRILWIFMKGKTPQTHDEGVIACRYIAALQPSEELLGLWDGTEDKEEKERLRGTYILALRNLGELEFTAKNLAGILAQEKPNEFEFEELAVPLLGLKSFPWEFIELMNKAHSPSGEAALTASLGKPPSTCNFT